jgi:hypothetical protein
MCSNGVVLKCRYKCTTIYTIRIEQHKTRTKYYLLSHKVYLNSEDVATFQFLKIQGDLQHIGDVIFNKVI